MNNPRIFIGDNFETMFRSFNSLVACQKDIIKNGNEYTPADIEQAHRTLDIYRWVKAHGAAVRVQAIKRPIRFLSTNVDIYLVFESHDDAVECVLRFGEKVRKVYEE